MFSQIKPALHPRLGVAIALLVVTMGTTLPSTPAALSSASPVPVAAPCIPAGHGAGVVPAVSFGRKGGNIRPYEVDIAPDGTIAYSGTKPLANGYAITWQAVQGIVQLAGAMGFWTWPGKLTASHPNPDVGTFYVTVRQGCSNSVKTVSGPGMPLLTFAELYDTLVAATGLGTGTSPSSRT